MGRLKGKNIIQYLKGVIKLELSNSMELERLADSFCNFSKTDNPTSKLYESDRMDATSAKLRMISRGNSLSMSTFSASDSFSLFILILSFAFWNV